MKKLAIAVLLSSISAWANAELMNIAAGAYQTADQAATACAIVDVGTTLVSGAVMLVVLAEGSGNPDLRVWSMDRQYVTTNNDWADGFDIAVPGETSHINLREIDPEGGLLYPTLLRAPAKLTDAAVLVLARIGERICATTYDRSGPAQPNFVALSITDLNAIVYKSQQLKSLGLADMPRDPREVIIQKIVGGLGVDR